jgi:hypothetical protein
MNKLLIAVSFIIVTTFIFSCKKTSDSPSNTGHVFIATTQVIGNQSLIRYFKDSNATTIDESSGYNNSKAIVAVGQDIYIAGDEVTNDSITHAKYWKNGNPVVLGDLSRRTLANGISVEGSDVYVAGNDQWKAVYWKNGLEINLTSDTLSSNATGIAVIGSDVYLCGYHFDPPSNYSRAFCMKNGVELSLQNDSDTYASGLFIDGNDVYVCGAFTNETSIQQSCYWKNGQLVKLTKDEIYAYATGIFVSNGIAFVCGNISNSAAYWVSSQEILPDPNYKNSYASAIAVDGNNVYVIGGEAPVNTLDYKAAYWTNGILSIIGDNIGTSYGTSIFLQK